MTPKKKPLSKRLLRKRNALVISQSEMARRIGVALSVVRRIESGKGVRPASEEAIEAWLAGETRKAKKASAEKHKARKKAEANEQRSATASLELDESTNLERASPDNSDQQILRAVYPHLLPDESQALLEKHGAGRVLEDWLLLSRFAEWLGART